MATIGRMRDETAAVVLSFLSTFGVWLLADTLNLSAVLTLVAFAITLGRLAPERMGARRRRASYAVWDVVVFVLNVLAFVLIGLQLRGIMERLGNNIVRSVAFALAVLRGDRRDTRCVGDELLRSQPMEISSFRRAFAMADAA